MEITDVRVRTVLGGWPVLAYAAVTFDECFVVHHVKIIDGENGMFVAMPSRRVGLGEYKDVAHPITQEFRAKVEERILEKYRSVAGADDAAQAENRARRRQAKTAARENPRAPRRIFRAVRKVVRAIRGDGEEGNHHEPPATNAAAEQHEQGESGS